MNDYIQERLSISGITNREKSVMILILISIILIVIGIIFNDLQNTLFAFASTGIFASILIYYILPQTVPALVYTSTNETVAQIGEELMKEYDLKGTPSYVPVQRSENTALTVRLFLPKNDQCEIPEKAVLRRNFVIEQDGQFCGISIDPIGARLYSKVNKILTDSIDPTSQDIQFKLTEIITTGLELVERASYITSEDSNKIIIGITEQKSGSLDQFDHPVPSFLATGLAISSNSPITVDVIRDDSNDFDYLIVLRLIPI